MTFEAAQHLKMGIHCTIQYSKSEFTSYASAILTSIQTQIEGISGYGYVMNLKRNSSTYFHCSQKIRRVAERNEVLNVVSLNKK